MSRLVLGVSICIVCCHLSTAAQSKRVKYTCSLRYENEVRFKPNVFVTTYFSPGFCGIRSHESHSRVNYSLLKFGVVGGVVYDAASETVYFSSESTDLPRRAQLNALNLNDDPPAARVILDGLSVSNVAGIHSGQAIVDLAYDWLSKNVYLNLKSCIWVLSLARPANVLEVVSNRTLITSLALHPARAQLFFSDGRLNYEMSRLAPNSIFRANLDGSNATRIRQRPLGDLQGFEDLAIDFRGERLYWSVSLGDTIQSSNLDGGELATVSGLRVHHAEPYLHAHTIALDDRFVYYPTSRSGSVRRFDKRSLETDRDFLLVNDEGVEMTGIVVYDAESQRLHLDDARPCVSDNGGCEEFCFAVPADGRLRRACGCRNGERLAPDGRSCAK